MRFLKHLLAVAGFLPLAAQAQFRYAPGTYQLADGSQGAGSLQFNLASFLSASSLQVRNDGVHKKATYPLSYVRSFTIDGHSFVRVEVDDLPETGGYDQQYYDPIFLEVADTGKVQLYIYHYFFQQGNYTESVHMPVMQRRGTKTYQFYSPKRLAGFDKKALLANDAAALFADDPELQRRFLSGAVTFENILSYVRAYNRGEKQPN